MSRATRSMRVVLARAALLTTVALVALSISGTAYAAPPQVRLLTCAIGVHTCVTNGSGAEACLNDHLCLFDDGNYSRDFCRWCLWGGGSSDRVLVTDLHTERTLRYRPGFAAPSGQGMINLDEFGFTNATSSFVNNTRYRIDVDALNLPSTGPPPLGSICILASAKPGSLLVTTAVNIAPEAAVPNCAPSQVPLRGRPQQ